MDLEGKADDDRLAIVLGVVVREQEQDMIAAVATCDLLQFKVSGGVSDEPDAVVTGVAACAV